MSDAAALAAKAAAVRAQARALHEADTRQLADTYDRVGRQRDDLEQRVEAARAAAKVAQDQAAKQHAKAAELAAEAQRLEHEVATDPFIATADDDKLETAQKLRAIAAAAGERAAEAHRDANAQQQSIRDLEHQLGELQRTVDPESSPVERLADQLDLLADHYAEAAANLTDADRRRAEGNEAAAEAMVGQADHELRRAAAIRPAYDTVDAEVLRAAGVERSDVDLLDPVTVPGPTEAAPGASTDGPAHDADLLDPVGTEPGTDAPTDPSAGATGATDATGVTGATGVADATGDAPADAPAVDEAETLDPFAGEGAADHDPAPVPPIDEAETLDPFVGEPEAMTDPVVDDAVAAFDDAAATAEPGIDAVDVDVDVDALTDSV